MWLPDGRLDYYTLAPLLYSPASLLLDLLISEQTVLTNYHQWGQNHYGSRIFSNMTDHSL